MSVTRRSVLSGITAGVLTRASRPALSWGSLSPAKSDLTSADRNTGTWDVDWDQAVLGGLLKQMDKSYDPDQRMSNSYRGPEYNYQSNLRSTTVHPIRDAFEYVLALLEAEDSERTSRALTILERTVALQDVDPQSKWFGLWSYYLEEPLAQMSTVDFNWAEFNGSTLLLIVFRHGAKLPLQLLERTKVAIRRAAVSIRRRDISPHYTNIMAQGTFVVFAAAELLGDNELLGYARHRIRHWAEIVDGSGSFSEYNSPAYTPLTIENMTRMRMYVHNADAVLLAKRLERLAWEQMAAHWHAPTMQLAGPMARAYLNDIGSPLWLQKGTNNQVSFVTKSGLLERGGPISAVILDYNCPADLRPSFINLRKKHVHREEFISGSVLLDTLEPHAVEKDLEPVQGTTFLTPAFSLGSANRSDFWVQRRPLLAYWGGRERPAQSMQLRVVKDDYDFASASFYSVQEQGALIGAVAFRNDGGDKHPLIDRIQDGTFPLQQIYVEFTFGCWNSAWKMLVDGKVHLPGDPMIPLRSRVAIDTGSCKIGLQVHFSVFDVQALGWNRFQPTLQWHQQADHAALRLTLYSRPRPAAFHWKDVQDAGVAFTCWFSDASVSLSEFDEQYKEVRIRSAPAGGTGASPQCLPT